MHITMAQISGKFRRGGKIVSDTLKAMGLRSLVHLAHKLVHPFRDYSKVEPPKRVFRRSRLHAICVSVVHLIPMTVFSWLLFLNYRKAYYGPGLSVDDRSDATYLALFQVAAKAMELICLTSLCTVLLHVLRDDMVHGDGISLGLLTSPTWFTSPVNLLSPEFLTSVQISFARLWRFWQDVGNSKQIDGKQVAACWRRTRLTMLIFVLALVAAFIGPASAVLLIPRIQGFPAGGVTYSLNATFEEMWPSTVSSNAELEMCFESNATQNPFCPSGGYSSFRYHGGFNGLYDAIEYQPTQAAEASLWFISSLVLDRFDLAPAMLAAGVDRRGARRWMPTYMIQPNLYTVVKQQVLFTDWIKAVDNVSDTWGALPYTRNFRYAKFDTNASALSIHPLTHVRCSVPQNLSSEADTIGFHFIEHQPLSNDVHGWSQDYVTKPVNISVLSRNTTNHVRVQWIPLAVGDFGPVSTGLLFEMPWTSSGNDSSRLAVSCTIVASWAQGQHDRSPKSNYLAWFVHPGSQYDRNITIDTSEADIKAERYNKRIELTKDWLDLLTPPAPDPPPTNDSWRPSTLENIFHAAGFDTLMEELRYQEAYIGINGGNGLVDGCEYGILDPNLTDVELWDRRVCLKQDKMSYIERTIARLVTDGLSRRLSYRAFERLPNLRSWVPIKDGNSSPDYNDRLLHGDPSKNAVTLPEDPSVITQRLEIVANGYGYFASTTTDYLSTFVVAIYLIIATLHVFWTVIFKPITSNSWNSTLELVLLAFNSKPEPALRGTGAEVYNWNTYKQTVRVQAEEIEPLRSGCADRDREMQVCLTVETNALRTSTRKKASISEQQLLEPTNNIELANKVEPAISSSAQDGRESPQTSTLDQQHSKYQNVEIGRKYY